MYILVPDCADVHLNTSLNVLETKLSMVHLYSVFAVRLSLYVVFAVRLSLYGVFAVRLSLYGVFAVRLSLYGVFAVGVFFVMQFLMYTGEEWHRSDPAPRSSC